MFEAVIISSLVLIGINTAITVDAYSRTARALDTVTAAAQRPALIQEAKNSARLIGKTVRTARYCHHPIGDRLYRMALAEVAGQDLPEDVKGTFRQELARIIAQGPDRKAMARINFSCEAARPAFDQGMARLPG